MIVKDRVARGDNKYLMKQLNDGTGRIELTPSPDEVIEEGTVLNKSVLQPLFDGLDKIATVETVVNQGKQEIQSATNEAVERLSNAQPESNPKIYTTTELSDPQEGKIYNVKIEEATSTINEKPVYKENTSESVTLKAGKVATVYYQGGNFFYKANASGDALAEHVLAGKTFSNSDDTDITGTMENHGAKIFKPSTANIIISKGFHDGTGYVEGDPDLVSGNIVQGKQIFGVNGSAEIITPKQKEGLANAVTGAGVATSTTASIEQITSNIRWIPTMNLLKPLNSGFKHNSVKINLQYVSNSYGGSRYRGSAKISLLQNTLVLIKYDTISYSYNSGSEYSLTGSGLIPIYRGHFENSGFLIQYDRENISMYFVTKSGQFDLSVYSADYNDQDVWYYTKYAF